MKTNHEKTKITQLPNGTMTTIVTQDGTVYDIHDNPNGNGVQDLIDWGKEQIKANEEREK